MKRNPYIISFIAGLIASSAWLPWSTGLLMIIAFVLYITIYNDFADSRDNNTRIFLQLLPGFLTFNILTFSWLHKVSVPGAITAIMINSFMMPFVFWLSILIRRRTGKLTGFITLASAWLAYEHLTMIIPVFSPWLNLGNVFGHDPRLVQWYEYTGSAGGSLWIIVSAIMITQALTCKAGRNKILTGYSIIAAIVILVPITFSLVRYSTYKEQGEMTEIVIIQPNMDPFTEKFGSIPFSLQLDRMIAMADSMATANTDWIIFPETAVDDPFFENEADTNRYVLQLRSFMANKPRSSLLTGITTMVSFTEKPGYWGNAANKKAGSDLWYEIYNSAMAIHLDEKPRFYHKSKLVPAIERRLSTVPSVIEKLVPELGGTISGYGMQQRRGIFINPATGTKIAPVICYESVFGKYVTEFVSEGAQVLFIITNDGWWRYTAGYRQHLHFASLRAIETRRSVARAANTGISCFIDQRGKIISESAWWEPAVMKDSIRSNDRLTFYTLYGDYISRYADTFIILIMILAFIAAPLRKKRFG